MTRDVQLPEPASELLAVARATVRPWLARLAGRHVSAPLGVELDADLDDVLDESAARLLSALEDLLVTDVDAQAMNPLSLFRGATDPLTAWLLHHGLVPAARDPFATGAFPDDVFAFYPARWDDIDASLQSPGITWSAWKAMTVLQRRRAEGLR